jgi:Secretion system C-terminal sorting domain
MSSAQAQTQYQFFDGADTVYSNSVNIEIDTNSSNIWQIGPPQKTFYNSAASQPNVIVTDTINNYPINNVSSFHIKIENNLGWWGIYALQWVQKLDMDSDHDGGIIEFTTDDGLTWQNVFNNPMVYNFYGFSPANTDTLDNGEFAFSGRDTSWKNIWLCFDVSWMTQLPDTITLRFTFKSDSINNAREGWIIDDFISHPTFIHTIQEAKSDQYITVYPNPSNGIVNIETEKKMEFHLIETMELINAKGEVVERWKNIPTKYWFDSKKYATGFYLLKIKTNFKSETIPLVFGD